MPDELNSILNAKAWTCKSFTSELGRLGLVLSDEIDSKISKVILLVLDEEARVVYERELKA